MQVKAQVSLRDRRTFFKDLSFKNWLRPSREPFLDVFVRPVDTNRRVARLLFIMGATWHNKCLFDIDAEEESMADILNKMGIETYAFNNFGIGPERSRHLSATFIKGISTQL